MWESPLAWLKHGRKWSIHLGEISILTTLKRIGIILHPCLIQWNPICRMLQNQNIIYGSKSAITQYSNDTILHVECTKISTFWLQEEETSIKMDWGQQWCTILWTSRLKSFLIFLSFHFQVIAAVWLYRDIFMCFVIKIYIVYAYQLLQHILNGNLCI